MNTPELNHALTVFSHLLPRNQWILASDFVKLIHDTYTNSLRISTLTDHLSLYCVALTRTHHGLCVEYVK